jgi:hypothetical protein
MLTFYPGGLEPQSSYFCLLRAGITGVSHRADL